MDQFLLKRYKFCDKTCFRIEYGHEIYTEIWYSPKSKLSMFRLTEYLINQFMFQIFPIIITKLDSIIVRIVGE